MTRVRVKGLPTPAELAHTGTITGTWGQDANGVKRGKVAWVRRDDGTLERVELAGPIFRKEIDEDGRVRLIVIRPADRLPIAGTIAGAPDRVVERFGVRVVAALPAAPVALNPLPEGEWRKLRQRKRRRR